LRFPTPDYIIGLFEPVINLLIIPRSAIFDTQYSFELILCLGF